MENPIIKYGKEKENAIQKELNEQAYKRDQELVSIKLEVMGQYLQAFESVNAKIVESGVTMYVEFTDDRYPSQGIQLVFMYGKKTFRMDWSGEKSYRYCCSLDNNVSMAFGEWPVEDLLYHLYLKFFKD